MVNGIKYLFIPLRSLEEHSELPDGVIASGRLVLYHVCSLQIYLPIGMTTRLNLREKHSLMPILSTSLRTKGRRCAE